MNVKNPRLEVFYAANLFDFCFAVNVLYGRIIFD
jgi:hypothetical protein